MVYNTDVANSLADAQWYAGQRGLQADYMGFNFGASYPNLALADFTSGPIVCQTGSTLYRGITDNTWAGASLHTALQGYFSKYKNGGILCATYTPNAINDGVHFAPLCGYAAYDAPGVSIIYNGLANGRMGWVGSSSNSGEYVSKAGGSLFRTAVVNALAAEAVSHLTGAHWGSNSANVTYAPYITQTDTTALLTWLQGQGITTVNLGIDYPFNGGTGADWLTGSVPSKPAMFAFIEASAAFNNYDGYGGIAPYTNNYTPTQGAWGCTWTSSGFNFPSDLFWNGGCAAISCIDEPLAGGLIDPMGLAQALMAQRLTLAEAVICTTSYGSAVNEAAYPGHIRAPGYYVSAFGDPLYRPYKSTPLPAQLPYFGILPGGVKVN